MSGFSSLYVLRHLPTNTYYGTRRSLRQDASDISPKSYSGVHIRPSYNVVGFERFTDAIMVADSIATHRSVYDRNPDDMTTCVYREHNILVDAIDHDLWVTEVKKNDMIERLMKYNLGFRIVHDINVSDKGNINIEFKELSLKDDKLTNYDFIDILENNLHITWEDDL